MLRPFSTTFLTLALCIPAFANASEWAQARELIATNKSAEAIELLENLDDSDEKKFWLGRALIEQKKFKAAAQLLSKIPAASQHYTAASKALIYCAWVSEELNLPETLSTLAQSSEPIVAEFAKAAMLEEQLYHDNLPENAENIIAQMKVNDPTGRYRQVIPLMEIDILRLKGLFDQALEKGRQLENNLEIPTSTRHRAKILLSQIFYSEAKQNATLNKNSESPEDTAKHTEDLKGQGEETLIQFVSENPDSQILEEVFHELYRRGAFEDSRYLRPALEDWTEAASLIHTTRAAIALRCLYYLDSKRNQTSTSLLNTALAACPREEATYDLLLTTIRDALNTGNEEQSEQYLKLLTKDGNYEQFQQAQLLALKGNFEEALPLFLKTAKQAEGILYETAISNAFLAALHLGQQSLCIQLMEQANKDETKARMLSKRAAFYMKTRPEQSEADARIICSDYADTTYFIDAQLDLVQLIIPKSLSQAIDRFRRIDTSKSKSWSDDVLARYFAMRINLAIDAQKNNISDVLTPLQVIEESLSQCNRASIRAELVFKYSYYLALEERYEDAANALLKYTLESKDLNIKAQALLRAGIAEEQLNTLNSLKRAIEMYKSCAEIDGPYQTMASLRAASILTRLGEGDDALIMLDYLEKKQSTLSVIEQCLLFSELADAWACSSSHTDESHEKALVYCKKMVQLQNLPIRWQNRAHLQYAILAARFGETATAVEQYKAIIENAPQLGIINLRGDWYILNTAATGAIIELSYLKRFDEALEIAESMAKKTSNPLVVTFEKWSGYIRKARNIFGESSTS